MTKKEFLKAVTDKFLGWRLPEHFHPDAGISFTPTYRSHDGKNYIDFPHQPVGTNLFCADQAEAMFEFCVGEIIDGLLKRAEAAEARIAEAEKNGRLSGVVIGSKPQDWKFDVELPDAAPIPSPDTQELIRKLKEENDALKARIEEAEPMYLKLTAKPEHRDSLNSDEQVLLIYPNELKDYNDDGIYVVTKLYADPPETQEAIRKSVEEERESCAKICDNLSDEYIESNYGKYPELKDSADQGARHCAAAIRSRSTKEK